MSRRSETVVLTVIVLAAAILILSTQPLDVFWGSDSGNRFIQLQSFLRTGGIAIERAPHIGHHFVAVRGKVYSFYDPIFPLASAPFYAALGLPGLFVLPIVGTLLLIALLPLLTSASPVRVGLLVVFATPIFWYTIVFWEHTIAAALAIAAVTLAKRQRFIAAGLLAGASTLFREEGYIVIASIAVALMISRMGIRFVVAAAVTLLPLWYLNWRVFGHPAGLHALVYESISSGGKLSNFLVYLFEFTSVRPWAIILAAPAILLIVFAAVPIDDRIRVALFVLAGVASCLSTIFLFRTSNPLHETLYLQGLFLAIPFSIAMFLAIRDLWSTQRFLLVTVLTGVVLTTLALNQADIGVIWGPRHYLWLVPLIMVLAVDAVSILVQRSAPSIRAILIATAAVLVVASFADQSFGLRILREKLQFSKRVLQTVRSSPSPVVVTDVFWIPEDLAAAFYEKTFVFVSDDSEFSKVLGERFLFIASREFRRISNRAFEPMMPRVSRRVRIVEPDLGLDVMLLEVGARNSVGIEVHNDHAYVQVRVDGSKPLWFLIDSGAAAPVNFIDRAAALRLGLNIEGGQESGAIGGRTRVAFAPPVTLTVGNVTFPKAKLGVLPLSDQQAAEEHAVEGILGFPFFRDFNPEIDYPHRRMLLSVAAPPEGAIAMEIVDKNARIRAQLTLHAGDRPIPVLLVVDTGYDGSLVLNTPFVKKHQLLSAASPQSSGGSLGGTTGGGTMRIAAITIGTSVVPLVDVRLSSDERGAFSSGDVDGYLGGHILQRYSVGFDYAHHRLILRP